VRQQGRPQIAIPKDEDLVFLNELIETGKVAPVIDRTYQHPTAIRLRFIAAGELICWDASNDARADLI